MVSSPAETPVTTPDPEMDALVVVRPHVPPETVSESVVVPSTQTTLLPEMTPVSGDGLMLMTFVVAVPPQVLITV